MQGCSVLYFTMSISPTYLEAAANVAVTARSLGVRAFVNLSQMTVSEMSETATTSSPHQKQHWLAEQMLRWSGLPVVYLRPTAFFDGLFLVLGAFEPAGGNWLTIVRYGVLTVLGCWFLYYGIKAVQLTDMGNRVWKRSAEYGLILAERKRLGQQ